METLKYKNRHKINEFVHENTKAKSAPNVGC